MLKIALAKMEVMVSTIKSISHFLVQELQLSITIKEGTKTSNKTQVSYK